MERSDKWLTDLLARIEWEVTITKALKGVKWPPSADERAFLQALIDSAPTKLESP